MDQETVTVIEELLKLLDDAHDNHVYSDDDEHPDDCQYCAGISRAEVLLTKHKYGAT